MTKAISIRELARQADVARNTARRWWRGNTVEEGSRKPLEEAFTRLGGVIDRTTRSEDALTADGGR